MSLLFDMIGLGVELSPKSGLPVENDPLPPAAQWVPAPSLADRLNDASIEGYDTTPLVAPIPRFY